MFQVVQLASASGGSPTRFCLALSPKKLRDLVCSENTACVATSPFPQSFDPFPPYPQKSIILQTDITRYSNCRYGTFCPVERLSVHDLMILMLFYCFDLPFFSLNYLTGSSTCLRISWQMPYTYSLGAMLDNLLL
jgi:hypothetical protein